MQEANNLWSNDIRSNRSENLHNYIYGIDFSNQCVFHLLFSDTHTRWDFYFFIWRKFVSSIKVEVEYEWWVYLCMCLHSIYMFYEISIVTGNNSPKNFAPKMLLSEKHTLYFICFLQNGSRQKHFFALSFSFSLKPNILCTHYIVFYAWDY